MLTTNQKRIQAENRCEQLERDRTEAYVLLTNVSVLADYLYGLLRQVDDGTRSKQSDEWREKFSHCEKSYEAACTVVGHAHHKARAANTTRPVMGA